MTVEDGGCEFETTYHDQTWQEQCSFMLWSLRVLVKNEYLLLPEDSILESSVGPTLGWKEVLWSPFFLPRSMAKLTGTKFVNPVFDSNIWNGLFHVRSFVRDTSAWVDSDLPFVNQIWKFTITHVEKDQPRQPWPA